MQKRRQKAVNWPAESTRKGGVVKRRKHEREGKKGMIIIVLKSGWIRIVK